MERTFHISTRLNQVASGFGFTFVPASVDFTRQPGVVALPLTGCAATIPVMAAWRTNDASSGLLAFVAALKSSRLAPPAGASPASAATLPLAPSEQSASGQKPDPGP